MGPNVKALFIRRLSDYNATYSIWPDAGQNEKKKVVRMTHRTINLIVVSEKN